MRKPLTRLALTLIASLCIFSSVFSQKEKERIASYIEQYKELAIKEMIRTGIPASITLAQGLLETGFGQSDLALNANNHFGIKCKSDWTGESVLHDDDKKGECFRKYPSVEDSYKDHSNFLMRPNYAFLFNIDPKDYQGWAYGLKKAGYATNPAYAQKLIKYIEDNNLQQYSLLALERQETNKDGLSEGLAFAVTKDAEQENASSASVVKAVGSVTNSEVAITNAVSKEKVAAYPKGSVFTINNARVLYVDAGTSLFAIAAINNISYNKLLDFNDLDKVDIVNKDQLIFLEKKQRHGLKDFHVVEAEEDLHAICQTEGVQLNSILEFNHLSKASRPVVGQKLYLKATAPVSTKVAGSFQGSMSSSS